ncbi:hypothetical protein TrRE_jg12114, partial [Triparma retinervis]
YDLSFCPTFDRPGWNALLGPACSLSPTLANGAIAAKAKAKGKGKGGKKGKEKTKDDKNKTGTISSQIWYPSTREEWDDCVSEMTALCSQAAYRLAVSSLSPSVSPPLASLYIRERCDIDEPLRGLQVREGGTGYLQGFAMWTTFTTWTPYFRWESGHPKSGMKGQGGGKGQRWDVENVLGAALEAHERMGDPKGQGVVWPKLAEISLVGALGCGDVLVTLALDALSSSTHYSHAVLQATPSSLTFYERYGFARVGAVAMYEGGGKRGGVVGYRHWTYADEKHLKKHGGPSYMMALSLKEYRERRRNVGGRRELTELVRRHRVATKPEIVRVEEGQVEEVFGGKYSDFDRTVQSHPGFSFPQPKAREKKKKGEAGGDKAGGPPKKRRRIPDIWMAVPLEENAGGVRRVNKYTASKMEGSGERTGRFERKAKKEGIAKAEQMRGGSQNKGSGGKGGGEEESGSNNKIQNKKEGGKNNNRRSPRTGECDV